MSGSFSDDLHNLFFRDFSLIMSITAVIVFANISGRVACAISFSLRTILAKISKINESISRLNNRF